MIHRIIGRLDIKGPNLVKGIHLEGLRVLGKPEEFAKYYYENGIDELIYIDVVASLFGRNSLEEIITKTAREIFIPLTVGGGLRTIDDIRSVLRAGADKVSLNTAAINNPQIIKEASRIFGSSTITVTIEAIKQKDGSYLAFTDNGREHTGVEVLGWAKKAEQLGAGEILLTSIDKDGTGEGFDLELTKMISKNVSIPVIASGGAGKKEDVYKAISNGGADAVALASLLHYNYLKTHKDRENGEEGNTEFLKSGQSFSKVEVTSIEKIKNYLQEENIDCRN
ncbi:imidazole glycerol phosphate synthase cyclase subunit [Candidatus Daviesbacteria bacterium RIFCSPHIGHO2_02_FULL_36_13]|uniref:imidazole glycerol-phosphate synthase n=1 Tax=Candidatus Daviesbacteria bacterium RIFCSPHIGHO2_02_FULL_36_13 TaxID=1797768 RepID=A0A1F5JP86_9BACT|nr:MAG: imidazole glycerol phosphate synthase cyclase subunit [Candidatus Daviesbacteria bacterium RIFCSPHIGHO2_02_FULL_36_13]OGE43773.1 MAG: imidazole glycerol phosphate synthase cyclase subunit [Candidatus Daviesbacteria bacterium RIFCSPLOWO2_01_FULL_36_8]